MNEEKPLFIPLNTEHYENFKSGIKTEELRLNGPRWNKNTCRIGRKAVLSKGYGKQNRMVGVIWKFKVQHGTLFGSEYKEALIDIYGTLDVAIACISIKDLEPIKV